jgi:hypothetical protein
VYLGVKDWKAGESNTKKTSGLQKNEKSENSGILASFGIFKLSFGTRLFVLRVIPYRANQVMPFVGSNHLIFPANVKLLLVLP